MTVLDFKTIGLKIKKRRQELGITQEHIANARQKIWVRSFIMHTHIILKSIDFTRYSLIRSIYQVSPLMPCRV